MFQMRFTKRLLIRRQKMKPIKKICYIGKTPTSEIKSTVNSLFYKATTLSARESGRLRELVAYQKRSLERELTVV